MPTVPLLSFDSTRGLRPDLSSTVQALLDEYGQLYGELQNLLHHSSSSPESARGINPTEQIQRAEALRKKLDVNIRSQGAIHYIDTYNTAVETFKLPLSYLFATTTGEVDAGLFTLREKALRTVQDSEGRRWKEFSTPNVCIQAFWDVEWRPQAGINLYQGFVRDVVYRTKKPGQLNLLDDSHIHVVHGWKDRHTQLMDDSRAELRATSVLIRLSHTACQARVIGTIPNFAIKTALSHRRAARQRPVLTVLNATRTVSTVVQSDLQGVIQSAIQTTIQTVIQAVVRNMLPPNLGSIIRIMRLPEQTKKASAPFLADSERALRALRNVPSLDPYDDFPGSETETLVGSRVNSFNDNVRSEGHSRDHSPASSGRSGRRGHKRSDPSFDPPGSFVPPAEHDLEETDEESGTSAFRNPGSDGPLYEHVRDVQHRIAKIIEPRSLGKLGADITALFNSLPDFVERSFALSTHSKTQHSALHEQQNHMLDVEKHLEKLQDKLSDVQDAIASATDTEALVRWHSANDHHQLLDSKAQLLGDPFEDADRELRQHAWKHPSNVKTESEQALVKAMKAANWSLHKSELTWHPVPQQGCNPYWCALEHVESKFSFTRHEWDDIRGHDESWVEQEDALEAKVEAEAEEEAYNPAKDGPLALTWPTDSKAAWAIEYMKGGSIGPLEDSPSRSPEGSELSAVPEET